MNVQKVQRVEIDDSRNKQVMEIDSNKPFAIVLPIRGLFHSMMFLAIKLHILKNHYKAFH